MFDRAYKSIIPETDRYKKIFSAVIPANYAILVLCNPLSYGHNLAVMGA
jgi:hypothetical protein